MSSKSGSGENSGPPPECPMHFGSGALGAMGADAPFLPGEKALTYNDYLKIPELLALQQPESKPPHHDEMLFIIIHQAYELWFKQVLHELATTLEYVAKGEPLRARHFLNRVVEIQKLLVKQIHILETMSPVDFLQFRDRLTPASGFQSSQFREVEFVAGIKDERYLQYFQHRPDFLARLQARLKEPDLRSSFYDLLRAKGLNVPAGAAKLEDQGDEQASTQILQAILPIYQNPDQHLPLYLFSEALIEFDEYLALWKEHHVRVVERVIGSKAGTGGSSGVEYLRSRTLRKAFPLLWQVRTLLSK